MLKRIHIRIGILSGILISNGIWASQCVYAEDDTVNAQVIESQAKEGGLPTPSGPTFTLSPGTRANIQFSDDLIGEERVKAQWLAGPYDFASPATFDDIGLVGREKGNSTSIVQSESIIFSPLKKSFEIKGRSPLLLVSYIKWLNSRFVAGNVVDDDGEWHAHIWNLQPAYGALSKLDAINDRSEAIGTRTEARSLVTIPVPKETSQATKPPAQLAFLFVEGSTHVPRISIFDSAGHLVWAHQYKVTGVKEYDAQRLIYSTRESRLILVGSADGRPMIMSMNASDGKSARVLIYTPGAKGVSFGHFKGKFNSILETDDGYYATGWINLKSNHDDDNDLLLVKYSLDYRMIWQRACGGTKADEGRSFGKDHDGNVFVGGATSSKDNRSLAWAIKLNGSGEVLGETALDRGSIVGFTNIFFNSPGRWSSYAIIDNGTVYELRMGSSPVQSRTWDGAYAWTATPLHAGDFRMQTNLTCVSLDDPLKEAVADLTATSTFPKSLMRDLRTSRQGVQ